MSCPEYMIYFPNEKSETHLELAANVATGTDTSYSSNFVVSAVTGNSINSLLFGSPSDAATAMAANAPSITSAAMGSATQVMHAI